MAGLTDSKFRVVIKARCIKNFSRCTLDSVENACEQLFGSGLYIKALIDVANLGDSVNVIVGAAQGSTIFGDQMLTASGGGSGSSYAASSPAAGAFSAGTFGGGATMGAGVTTGLASVLGMNGGYAFAVSDRCLIPGNGGDTPFGRGGMFRGKLDEAGVDGTGFGSGGSGSGKTLNSETGFPGGKGAPGMVIIYEYS
ncbi:DUF2612 domain-containing protein [Jejubacter calystegiae]|uniref:DUF2612 domain-containing protein n=2 Tax=Enterobacteriaceae TaxID=543 RepID=A0A4P8YPA8_9ENTR|nr:DUF2612 domain-containing protein [Jejubacter calystegiae]